MERNALAALAPSRAPMPQNMLARLGLMQPPTPEATLPPTPYYTEARTAEPQRPSWREIVAQTLDPNTRGNRIAMGFTGPAAIRAFHGSPHRFERFDMSRIGTGEGAQAFGHGLYFAQSEDVARGYRQALERRNISATLDGAPIENWRAAVDSVPPDQWRFRKVLDDYGRVGGDPQEFLQSQRNWYRGQSDMTGALDDFERRVVSSFTPGNMYEVNLNTTPNRLLDWDAPISQQPQAVREAISATGFRPNTRWEALPGEPNTLQFYGPRGQEATIRGIDRFGDGNMQWRAQYDTLYGSGAETFPTREAAQRWVETTAPIEAGRGAEVYQGLRQNMPDARISEALRAAGVDGIQYLDAGSRGAGQGTRNYVMFDDSLIDIIRRYGVAGMLGGGAAAGAAYE